MSKSAKYPNGYIPKIEYWADYLNSFTFHTREANVKEVLYAAEKLKYFCERELERKK